MAERAENQALSESLSSKSGMMFDGCSWFGVWRTSDHYIFLARSAGAQVGVRPLPSVSLRIASQWVSWCFRMKVVLATMRIGRPSLREVPARGLSVRDHPCCRAMALSQSHRVRTPANGWCQKRIDDGWPRKARHGPPRVGTMIWASRAALGADGRNGTDRMIHRRDEEPHRAEP
jgi:hypothetical protein